LNTKIFFLELLPVAEKIGKRIAALKEAACKAGIPVVYVNDNFGRWKSDFHTIIEYVIKENKPGKIYLSFLLIHILNFSGKALVELLLPTEDDCMYKKNSKSLFYFSLE
jgi:nicotinamidase-related amidase